LARPQRSVSAVLVAVVALAGLLAAGQWLQPRLGGPTEAASSTRPAPTSPSTTSPILAIDAAPDRPGHRPADRAEPRPGQRHRRRRGRGLGGVLPGPGPARAGYPPRPGQRPGHRQRWPPDPPLGRGGRTGRSVVRGAEGWLWRVDPAGDRQAGAIRLRTVPGGAELAGKLVVASGVLWVTDPGSRVVRRVDLRSGTEDRWEADGRHLAVTSGGTVWATSDTRLLGLGGPQVRGPRRNLHELETDWITAMAAAEDGGLWLGTARAVPRGSGRPAPGIAPPVVYGEQIRRDR
jgi:hypothetical protein